MSDNQPKLSPLSDPSASVAGMGFTNPFPQPELQNEQQPTKSKSDIIQERIVQVGISSLLSAQGVSPDDTVRSKEIGEFLGVPEGLVQKDLKKYEKDYAYKKNYLTIKDNNDLLAWASDSKKVQKTSDDLDALKAISESAKPKPETLRYYHSGSMDLSSVPFEEMASNYVGGLKSGPSTGRKETFETLTWADEIMNGRVPTQFKQEKPSDSWMHWIGEQTTKIPLQMGASAVSDIADKRMVQGGIGGGVFGSAVPAVGTASGAVVGAGSGLVVGIAEHQALQAYGATAKEAYDNAIQAGKTPEEAVVIAQEAGMASWAGTLLLGTIPAMTGVNALVKPILGMATPSIGRTILASGVENAVTEGLTEAVNVGAVEVAKVQSGMADNIIENPSPENLWGAVKRIGTASAVGGVAGGAMTGAMSGTGRLVSRFVNKAPTALNHEQVLTGVLDAMSKSKTLVRDPATFNEFAQFVLSDTQLHTADISYDMLRTQVDKNPDLWRAVFPDIDAKLDMADKTGENISLDMASFITYFQDDARELLPHIQTEQDGITAEEARETLKVLPQQIQKDLEDFANKLNEPSVKNANDYKNIIYDDVIRKLDEGGFDTNTNLEQKDKHGIAMIALHRAIGRSIQRYGTDEHVLNEYYRNPFIFQFIDDGVDADAKAQDAYNQFKNEPQPTVIDPNEQRYQNLLTYTSGKKAIGINAIKKEGKVKSDAEAQDILARLQREGVITPANKAGSHAVIANLKNKPAPQVPPTQVLPTNTSNANGLQPETGDLVTPPQEEVPTVPEPVEPTPEPIPTPKPIEPTPVPAPAPVPEPKAVTKVRSKPKPKAKVEPEVAPVEPAPTEAKPKKTKGKKKAEPVQEPVPEPTLEPEPKAIEPEPEEATPSNPVLSYEKGDYWVQSRGDLGYEIYKGKDDLSERVAVIEESGDGGLDKAKIWIDQNDGTAPVKVKKEPKPKKEKKTSSVEKVKIDFDKEILGEGKDIDYAKSKLKEWSGYIDGKFFKNQTNDLKKSASKEDGKITKELGLEKGEWIARVEKNLNDASLQVRNDIVNEINVLNQSGDIIGYLNELNNESIKKRIKDKINEIENATPLVKEAKPKVIEAIEKRLEEGTELNERIAQTDSEIKQMPTGGVTREINQDIYNESFKKWRDFSKDSRDKEDYWDFEKDPVWREKYKQEQRERIEKDGLYREPAISEEDASNLAFLEESFIASMSEGMGMSPREFYDLYKLTPTYNEFGGSGGQGGYFTVGTSKLDNRQYDMILNNNDVKEFIIIHETGHYYFQVLLDINQLVKNGFIDESRLSLKLKNTIKELRSYFHDNYDTLMEKQNIKEKQGRLDLYRDTANYRQYIPDLGGKDFLLHVFDSGLSAKGSDLDMEKKLSKGGATVRDAYEAARSIMHEAIAEAFEVYISKGTAPTPHMKSLFQAMAKWVVSVWEQAKGKLRRAGNARVDRKIDAESAYTSGLHKIFNDILTTEAEQVKTSPNIDIKNQSDYGRVTTFNKEFSVIQIFKKGDIATITHEFGHKFLDEFFFDAMDTTLTNPDTTLQEDFQATKNWMYESRDFLLDFQVKMGNEADAKAVAEIRSRGDDYIKSFIEGGLKATDNVDGYLRTTLHEGWARAFEAYVREGKAPNKGLRGAFVRFAKLIKQIYKDLRGYGVNMTPEIREVFDRLLLVDGKMGKLEAEYGITPLFKDGASAQMDDASFAGYSTKFQNLFGEISDKLRRKAMKAVNEKKTKVGREQIDAIRERLLDESDKSPEMQVYRTISTDEDLKIDVTHLQDVYGIDPSALPRGAVSEDGVSVTATAEALGVTPQELITILTDLENMRKSVAGTKEINMESARKLSVDRKAMDEFALLKDAENQTDGANELFDSQMTDILVDELNHLGKLQDENYTPVDVGAYKAGARSIFNKMSHKDAVLNVKKYNNSAKRTAKKAQEFFDKGNYKLAFKYKQQQIASFFLAKESRDFIKRFGKTERLVKKIARNKTIKGVSHGHMELLHTILNDYNLTTARSVKESRVGYDKPTLPANISEALSKFMDNDELGTRTDVYIGDTLQFGVKDPNKMTVEEYEDFAKTIHSIFQNGKNEAYIDIEGEKIAFNDMVTELAISAARVGVAGKDATGKLSDDSKTLYQELRDKGRNFFRKNWADMIKAETVFNEFDEYNPTGKWNQLNEEIQQGVDGVFSFWEGLDNIMAKFKDYNFDKALGYHRWSKEVLKPIPTTILEYNNTLNPETGTMDGPPQLWEPNKIDLINIAFHFGSPENMEKLIAGREYTDVTKQPTGWTHDAITKLVMDNLTEDDWKFVTMVSKHIGTAWKKIVETENKIHGYAPPEVITAPVQTPFGEIEGWYWPLVYEDVATPVLSEDKAHRGLGDVISSPSGTKERKTGVKKPVDLSFDRTMREIRRNVYYAHMAIPIKNMAKVLSDKRIKGAITHSKGELYHTQLKDWVKDMVNTNRRTAGESDYVKMLQTRLMFGTYMNIFGYAVKPVVDSLTDIASAPLKVGVVPATKATGYYFGHKLMDFSRFLKKGVLKAVDLIFATDWHRRTPPSQIDAWMDQFYAHRMRKGGADKRYADFKRRFVNKYGISGRLFNAVGNLAFWMIETSEGMRNAIYARGAYHNYIKARPNASMKEIHAHVNKMIRNSSPARDIADKALIQRDPSNSQIKLMISFSTALVNRLADDIGEAKMHWRNAKKGKAVGMTIGGVARRIPKALGVVASGKIIAGIYSSLLSGGFALTKLTYAMFTTMMYGFSYQSLSGAYEQDKDDKDDALEMAVKSLVGGWLGNFPVHREYYDVGTSNSPRAGSSLGFAHSAPVDAVRTMKGIINGKKDFDEDSMTDFIEAFGTLAGVPLKRPTAYFRYQEGVASGEIQREPDESLSETLRRLQAGK